MAESILWYDLETFGKNPAWDKVVQFAAVRTDDQFEPLEDPIILYCRITPDYIPDPQACLVTGITPQESIEKGMREYEFIKKIDQEFSRPGTCVAGYNSIRFDDEFIRNLYYRNFFDPYRREWASGNSRWDVIDLLRVTRDLRPDGINWPESPDGRPVFKLERLTAVNGLSHEHAHDALSDVYATIAVAKLVRDKQPRLFEWVYHHRKKEQLRPLINLETRDPFLHTSGMLSRKEGCTSIMAPLVVDPKNRNCILCFDLRENPESLIHFSVDQIRYRIFTPKDQLTREEKRIPIKGIHINKCPVMAPLATLDSEAGARLQLDVTTAKRHLEIIRSNPDILQKVRAVFEPVNTPSQMNMLDDPDTQIYTGGFFRDDDKDFFEKVHNTPENELRNLKVDCQDPRIPEMFRRFLGRNFPGLLDQGELEKWRSFCASRILFPPVEEAVGMGEYRKKLESYHQQASLPARDQKVLKALDDYARMLEKKVLEYKE